MTKWEFIKKAARLAFLAVRIKVTAMEIAFWRWQLLMERKRLGID